MKIDLNVTSNVSIVKLEVHIHVHDDDAEAEALAKIQDIGKQVDATEAALKQQTVDSTK